MSIALFSLLIVVLAQLLGTTYNYQFFNALGIPLSVHPITLEDNIQTALAHLPSFIASIVVPTILGFAFRFHTPKSTTAIQTKSKDKELIYKVFKHLAFPIAVLISVFISFYFLPTRTAQYASGFICLFYLLNITFDKIQSFSLKNDIAFALFCLLYLIFFVAMYLHKGESDGHQFKNATEIKYQIKIKDESEEFISCSSLRSFSNDLVCVNNKNITFIKKDRVQEIRVS